MRKIFYFLFICLYKSFLPVDLYAAELNVNYVSCMEKIPKLIWQTYLTKNLPKPAKAAQKTWLQLNPDYNYALWDDQDLELYIQTNWDPLTFSFFKALPLGVMKADLWRYLIIAMEGGVYSDIDSICCKPIRDWGFEIDKDIANVMLLGLENDGCFCQWTIAATPNHPAMHYVATFLVNNWLERGIDVSYPHFVHATTGPSIWTNALFNYLKVEGISPGDMYKKYEADASFKEYVNSLGVWLYPKSFYEGDASRNLYGSQFFGDGYVQWIREKDKLK